MEEYIHLVLALRAMNGAVVIARNVQVLIDFTVSEQVMPVVVMMLAVKNIRLALVLADIFGVRNLVQKKMLV